MSSKTDLLKNLVVENHSEIFVDKKILDAGCGDGNFEALLSKKKIPCRVVGVDVKGEVLEELRKVFPQHDFFNASLVKPLPFNDGEFNTVVMFDVIEHLPQGSEVEVLRELNRVLTKDGFLIITTAHSTRLNFLDPVWYFGHRHYSKNELSLLVERAGFAVKEIGLVGDFWWELDTILFYVFKHILRKEYRNPLRERFSTTDRLGKRGTRLLLLAQKS